MSSKIELILDEESAPEHAPTLAPELSHIQGMDVNSKTREVFVSGEIEEDFGAWFTVVMRYLEWKGKVRKTIHPPDPEEIHQPITVWLNTPGGDVNSMFTFHDLVRASPCPVTIIATGQVCSAGVLMLACGNHRRVTESCVLMSHRGEETLTGHLEQMEAQMKVVKWQEQHWSDLMARYTPETVDGQIRDSKHWFQKGKKTAEWWVTGGEAIVHEGLADEVYTT